MLLLSCALAEKCTDVLSIMKWEVCLELW